MMTKKRKEQIIERLHTLERTFNRYAYGETKQDTFEETWSALQQFLCLCDRHKNWTCTASCPEEQENLLQKLRRLFPNEYDMAAEELKKELAVRVVKRINLSAEELWSNRDTRTCSFEVLAGLAFFIRMQVGEV